MTKLNNYESKYRERIHQIRTDELKFLGRELTVWAMTLVLTVISPVLATSATFATYVLIDERNILTAAKTFTILLLFSALRFPINYMGRLIGRAGQALEAARRIEKFLEREIEPTGNTETTSDKDGNERDMDRPDNSNVILSVKDMSIHRGDLHKEEDGVVDEESRDESTFTLSGVSFEVQRGEIIAIVGPVGCGKSTLVEGIIGEATIQNGKVSKKGETVGYASQVPFILNSTLRENILFGRPYEKDRYEKVLEACCLRTDIDQLGPAKDLTEIGERGVTLSGGKWSFGGVKGYMAGTLCLLSWHMCTAFCVWCTLRRLSHPILYRFVSFVMD